MPSAAPVPSAAATQVVADAGSPRPVAEPERRRARRDEAPLFPTFAPSADPLAPKVDLVNAVAEADLDAPLPEFLPPLPERLEVHVADPLGDWAVEVQRHESSLDLLVRGDAELGRVVRDAEQELRRGLAESGHQVGLLQVASQGPGDRRAPPDAGPRENRGRASSGPASDSRASAGPEAPRRRGGLLVNRVV